MQWTRGCNTVEKHIQTQPQDQVQLFSQLVGMFLPDNWVYGLNYVPLTLIC